MRFHCQYVDITFLLLLILSLQVLLVILVEGSAPTTEQNQVVNDIELQQESTKKTVCPHAFESIHHIWTEFSFAIHRNGESESCTNTIPSQSLVIDQLRQSLSVLGTCHEVSLDKFQVETLLTELFINLAIVGCGPMIEPNYNKMQGQMPKPNSNGTFQEYCDPGPDHTVLQDDHASLIPISTAETLPCRWYTREGVRIQSIPQLMELIHSTIQSQPECTLEKMDQLPDDELTCTTAGSSTTQHNNNREEHSVLHLYAVPAGRVFMFAPSYVGETFHLNHVTDSQGQMVTLQVLSTAPRIFDISNFFNQEEADALLEKAMKETSDTYKFHRSTTGITEANVISKRTSENAWDTHGTTALIIKQRCLQLLGFDEYKESMTDGLQILRYNQTTAYTTHMDYLDNPENDSYDYDSSGKGGNRFATILLYFTTLEEGDGGETVFTRAHPPDLKEDEYVEFEDALQQLRASGDVDMLKQGSWEETLTVQCRIHLTVRPKALRAVLFYSQNPDGTEDKLSYHGGCPVLRGTKLAANLWTWSGIRPEYSGAPRKFEVEGETIKPKGQIHATFRNTKKDPRFRECDIYYDEDGYFGKLGFLDNPLNVNTYAGHRWNIKVNGETLQTFVIAADEPNQLFEI